MYDPLGYQPATRKHLDTEQLSGGDRQQALHSKKPQRERSSPENRLEWLWLLG